VEIIKSEPRRRWSDDVKLAAVRATFEPGETVNGVARRLGANTSMVFTWRKQLRAKLGFPVETACTDFTPVTVVSAPETEVAISQPTNGAIDIAFDGEVRMRITGMVEPALAAALAKVLARR
jgi:transposase-like protein